MLSVWCFEYLNEMLNLKLILSSDDYCHNLFIRKFDLDVFESLESWHAELHSGES